MILVSYFPPQLQRIATLPCEKHNIKNVKILVTYLTQYHHFALLLRKLTQA